MSSHRLTVAALAVTALSASGLAAQAQSPSVVTQAMTLAPGAALPTGNGNAAGINPALGGPNLSSPNIVVGSANGLKFNLNPTFDTTSANGALAYQGFQAAAGRWASLYSNNITINLTIGFSNLGNTGIIGQTGSTQANYGYSGVRTALIAGATSADDFNAAGHLVAGPNFTQRINYTSNSPNGSGSPIPYTVSSGAGTSTINMTNANAKALGVYAGSASANDATVTFNSSFAFDYNEADGVDSDKIDFLFVATHEIGHSLGFISGVDVLDGNSPNGSTFFQDNQFTYKSTLDLFRYSADSFAQGNGVTDFTASTTDKYLSFNGGTTKITSFARGINHGDGSQASHWLDNIGAGIMDPTAAYGEVGVIRQNDIRAFDAIGYTLAAPEPSEFAAMSLGVLGLSLLGLKARKRTV